MLKLRSRAIVTDRGNSPAANVVIVCGARSSVTWKSAAVRPVTGWPSRSVTVAYTSTRLTPVENVEDGVGATRSRLPLTIG